VKGCYDCIFKNRLSPLLFCSSSSSFSLPLSSVVVLGLSKGAKEGRKESGREGGREGGGTASR
jgi:hypothetical protein